MYNKFKKINGQHPWRDVSEEGFIDYPAYYRKGGRVLYFNYDLAKELGLIPRKHPSKLNPKLIDAILKTFSIRILNEHDWVNRKSLPEDHHADKLYMATRYLQLQHESKRGETSGDGRSVWNGYIKTKGKVFDVSSRGTGSTILSPGVAEAGAHVETGSDSYGYASGLADVEEMLGSAIMSEIFYREGIPTERCLCVIDYKDKTSVGVRTAPNLIRPAHLFRYLKLGQWVELKKSYDYFLKRQERNKAVSLPKSGKTRYLKSLDYLIHVYAKLVAVLEEEYIFNWLAWDGDNVLAEGAVLDYGSIRQFAAKHNKYRYEDVDRFSTSLTEQKYEAKNIVQTFVQAIDFIITKEKKSLKEFDNHSVLEKFDKCYLYERQQRMLKRIGFSNRQILKLIKTKQEEVVGFSKVFNYFENVKILKGEVRVPDGIDHPPVFLVRNILREFPRFLLKNQKKGKPWPYMEAEDFCQIMAGSYVEKKDLECNDYRRAKAVEFQDLYKELICGISKTYKITLKGVLKKSSVINYEFRRTGDGLTWIVNEALSVIDRIDQKELQDTIDRFIASQVLIPGKWNPIKSKELKGRSMKARLLRRIVENLELYKELI